MKTKTQLEKGCGDEVCINGSAGYTTLCEKCETTLTQTNEIIELIEEWGNRYCDEMQDELQELLTKIKGEEK